MSKIVIFSDQYLPTMPFLELRLYNELQSRGHEVLYVLQEKDIRLHLPLTASTFQSLNLATISHPKQIKNLITAQNVLVSRFDYKRQAHSVSVHAKATGAKILHLDPSGIDIRVRRAVSHYLTAKSENMRKAVLKQFPGAYKNICVTGTLHYDDAKYTTINKSDFMSSYGLDIDKKLVLLTPANPGEAYMPGLIDDYKKIVRIIQNQCPNYELMIKAHPMDYLAHTPSQPGVVHKNQHYDGKHSWEVFAPGGKVVKAHEGHMALKSCDVIVNIRSSLAMETALFFKPLVNVNRSKYVTNWPFMNGVMKDIKITELASTLNKNKYEVNINKCKEYIRQECYSDDGKAYYRTANVIEKILGE